VLGYYHSISGCFGPMAMHVCLVRRRAMLAAQASAIAQIRAMLGQTQVLPLSLGRCGEEGRDAAKSGSPLAAAAGLDHGGSQRAGKLFQQFQLSTAPVREDGAGVRAEGSLRVSAGAGADAESIPSMGRPQSSMRRPQSSIRRPV
jgi:hypothetical protein